ncbi:inverse autotransporter beta domain-containing protein [Candidatus Reidiella endopervernicosa]|uniref:Inverse autotransporter beta domain-containing protein n=1 Tax=Candidatus Reidiella endopervernicosa TaxID=2738883 RepID=A0A6N0HS35_9GAMM|nr:inverse autotransporter beta domain-containing protein [Candidatus Reidiella endopervernicosa]
MLPRKSVIATAVATAIVTNSMTNIARAEDFQANVEVFLSPGDPRHRGGIAAMVPFRKNNDSMSFVDGRFWLDDNTASEYNLAFGHRWFNSNRSSIFGLFGAFDHRKSSTDRDHNQLTAGAEMLMDDWELRGNYYYPLSDRYLVGVGGTNGSFSGNKLYANGIFEEALEGLDIEAGRSFALHGIGLDENWIHIGGYHFEGDAAGDVDGVSLRLTSFLRKNLSIGLAAQDDDLFGSEIRGEIRYSFGRASGGGKRTLSERMMQLVHRDIDVKTTAGVPDHLRTDLNSTVDVSPGAGVIHIDSSSEESTEDGSYEYPYKTIANCKAGDCGTTDNAMIYVHEGDSDDDASAYDTGAGWTLRDGQMLIGEGFDLYGIGGDGDYRRSPRQTVMISLWSPSQTVTRLPVSNSTTITPLLTVQAVTVLPLSTRRMSVRSTSTTTASSISTWRAVKETSTVLRSALHASRAAPPPVRSATTNADRHGERSEGG